MIAKNENDCSRIICWRRWGAAECEKITMKL